MIYFLENTNLLTWFEEQTKPCGIGHSCNCFHTFGSGIAKSIKDAYPQAYAADLTTLRASKDKLGIFSCATIQTVPHKIIYNIYGQFDFGRDKRYTSYDALFDGVSAMRSHAIENDIELLGLPQNIGCYRGGANWNIVEAILREIFAADKALSLVICHYNPSPI
jgi:O-acetyl-ADP-ribose deacetylase (regulator of RNase III)